MATIFLSNAKVFLPSLPSTSSSSSTTSNLQTQPQLIVCKSEPSAIVISRRTVSLSSLTATAAFLLSTFSGSKGFSGAAANAAILEAEDDEELLEKVKRDRKKRLEKQGVLKSSTKEAEFVMDFYLSSDIATTIAAYLQDLVYKLSKIGQAIEKNDLSTVSLVLGSGKDTEWIKKVNSALNKLSSSEEEKTEADAFSSSFASLFSSVSQNNIEASKLDFVASASAFEKWTVLSGLVGQLKGL
ncbi:hypothetical protein MIMGU_mgv1a012757mg [Erythranthe guttata]|uniref:Maintenance of Photosystem II under High light 2 C-terminal domain-containing protein n=1 Tax=Erythranthe guttata TaxID=4155 RepID=A0A022R455_ERYGU|nr:PREDICTED: thylakoid lumenal 16.5 kDa protein, chloroplastic isoform X1 [Erythranthe guttata]EYU34991.1 hypothetical protein MIMGU_mgv1a012757mg [Erythranthe guttata]|eukprot:XP_012840344.1 PREDICTED: thylakoid lumenal 16.5 kDa protein, chloroplastic isoform X1 [Erythranthe guttata]